MADHQLTFHWSAELGFCYSGSQDELVCGLLEAGRGIKVEGTGAVEEGNVGVVVNWGIGVAGIGFEALTALACCATVAVWLQ